jgi:hypothetical protein
MSAFYGLLDKITPDHHSFLQKKGGYAKLMGLNKPVNSHSAKFASLINVIPSH